MGDFGERNWWPLGGRFVWAILVADLSGRILVSAIDWPYKSLTNCAHQNSLIQIGHQLRPPKFGHTNRPPIAATKINHIIGH